MAETKPSIQDQIQFDLDGITYFYMLEGLPYEEAAEKARQDIKSESEPSA